MKYLLLITLLFCAAICFAESGFGVSGAFTMDTVNPVITVTNPTLGQEILNGDTLPITWTSEESNVPPNCINLSWRPDPATDWVLIAQNQPNSELYEWPVLEAGTNEAQVRVRMRDGFGNFGFGVSEPFVILPQDEPQEVHIVSTPSGATVYIDSISCGITPYIRMINPGESFTVSLQKANYTFSPVSILVQWMPELQTISFTGTYTGTGTVVSPFVIPDIWILADSPYIIPEPITIASDRNIIMQEGVQVISLTPAPITILGSLNATGVTYRSEEDSLLWGGLRFEGTDSLRTISNLIGCFIINATNPLAFINSSPVVDSMQITPADTLMAILNPGILIEGSSAPQLHNLSITNYVTGIKIVATEPQTRDTPSLSNIRIRNSSSSVRDPRFPQESDPKGVDISGCSSAVLSDVEIESYLTGVSVVNDSLLTSATPSLSNIRIRNSSSSVRSPSTGIVLEGYQSTTIADSQILDSTVGVVISSADPAYSSTPSLSNIRIRNSSSSVREPSVGISAGINSSPLIQNCEIMQSDTGVMAHPGSHPNIRDNVLRNCSTAIRSFSEMLPPLKGNLLQVEQSWAIEHPEVAFVGMEISSNPSCKVENNTFFGYPKILYVTNSTCVFENNIAWHPQPLLAPFQPVNSTLTARYNDVLAGPGAYTGVIASNNLNNDPLFASTVANDFHIHYNSPCIDAGNPSSALNSDGTRADMGAYPYLHKADFIIPEGSIDSGENVTFINTSIGHNQPITVVQWDLGNDGSVDAGTTDWTTGFAASGLYSLRLTMITGNLVDHSPVKQFQVNDTAGLPVPAALQAQIQGTQIILSWEAVGGATSYKIMASDIPNGEYNALAPGTGSFGMLGARVTWTAELGALNRRFYRIVASSQP